MSKSLSNDFFQQNQKINSLPFEKQLSYKPPNKIPLSSGNKEILNCSMCPGYKPLSQSITIPDEIDTNNTNINLTQKYISFCFTQEPRGGIIKFNKLSEENSNNQNSSANLESITQSVLIIQRNWRIYITNRKRKIFSYHSGIIHLLHKSKSVDANNKNLFNINQTDNPIEFNKNKKKVKHLKLKKIFPKIITKESKNNFVDYNQKNIVSNFKFRSAKNIKNNANKQLKLQLADIWINESIPEQSNIFTIQKKTPILKCSSTSSFSVNSPLKISKLMNTITWNEQNKIIKKNISIQIEKINKINDIISNETIFIDREPLYWNRKICIDEENQIKTQYDKINKSQYDKICFNNELQIERKYEKIIWNEVNEIQNAKAIYIPQQPRSLFYEISDADKVDYEIKLGKSSKEIMYTLSKRDIMFIWNKLNKIESDPFYMQPISHSLFSFREEEKEENKKLKGKKILKNSLNQSSFDSNEEIINEYINPKITFGNNYKNFSNIIPREIDSNNKKIDLIDFNEENITIPNDPSIQLFPQYASEKLINIFPERSHSIEILGNQIITSNREEYKDEFNDENILIYTIKKWNSNNIPSCSNNQKIELSFIQNLNESSFENVINIQQWNNIIYPSQEINIKYIMNKLDYIKRINLIQNKIVKFNTFTIVNCKPLREEVNIQTKDIIIDDNTPAKFEVNLIQNDFAPSFTRIGKNLNNSQTQSINIPKNNIKVSQTGKTKIKGFPKKVVEHTYSSKSPFYREIQKHPSKTNTNNLPIQFNGIPGYNKKIKAVYYDITQES